VYLLLFVQAPFRVKSLAILREILVFKVKKYPCVGRVRWLGYRGSLPQIQRKDSTFSSTLLVSVSKFLERTDHRLLGIDGHLARHPGSESGAMRTISGHGPRIQNRKQLLWASNNASKISLRLHTCATVSPL